jgi:hypothetical protein
LIATTDLRALDVLAVRRVAAGLPFCADFAARGGFADFVDFVEGGRGVERLLIFISPT